MPAHASETDDLDRCSVCAPKDLSRLTLDELDAFILDAARRVREACEGAKAAGAERGARLLGSADGMARADMLTRKHTAAATFQILLGELAETYRPTLRSDLGPELVELADLYDQAQAARGVARRAWRGR
jgi:hypothetical protein